MKYRFLVFVFCVSLLAGCATRPIANELAEPVSSENIIDNIYFESSVDTGQVTIKRDEGFGGSGCSTRFFVDAKPIVDLSVSEKIVLYIPEGDHILSAWPNGLCGGGMAEIKTTIKKGAEATFRIGWGSNGDFFISPTAF
ncbi:hypothetical protein [Maridesulfovibrio sp.]|uniref:hypothetical protein n=1 Tax=Maridesulfovibrio sp. TaxID=2795000 RepID=UPI0039EEB255